MRPSPPPPRTDLLDTVRNRLADAGADALLVTAPANVRYLSGFSSPEDARLLIDERDALLITDGRYIAQAAEESPLEAAFTRDVPGLLSERLGDAALAVEAEHVTVALYDQLEGALGRAPVKTTNLLTPMRATKSEAELDVLREAARITDVAFEHILGHIRPGAVELELALEIERAMVAEGADGAGFGIIVASGHRSAMPHGLASHKALALGELITFDFGAVLHGYHADMTRTVALGQPSDEHLALWNAVAEAHAAAVAEVAPGVVASDLDQRARGILAEHGLAELFAHSLGHGVGLDIHEGPSLSQRSDDVLEPGMAITVEPGVYRPGDAGVRTEDLVAVTAEGGEVFSHSPLELIVL